MTLLLYYLIMVMMVASCSTLSLSSNNAQDEGSDLKFIRRNFVPILIYSIFWGLRYDVGTDHLDYATRFASNIIDDRLEVGYLWFEKILHAFNLPFPFLFIITSMVNICAVFIVAKSRDRVFLMFLILFFWTSETVYFAQNGIRQMFAFSLVIVAICYLCNRKYIHGGTFLIGAYFFHASSVIFSLIAVIIWLLSNFGKLRINRYIILATYLGIEIYGQVFTILDFPILNELSILLGYEHHYDKLESWEFEIVEGSGLGAILRMVIFSCIILSQNKLLESNDRLKKIFYWLFVLGAVLHPILNPNLLLNRLCVYFSSTYFITFAFFSYELWKGNMSNKKASNLILLIFVLYNLAIMSKNYCTNGCKEYHSIFSSYNTTLRL